MEIEGAIWCIGLRASSATGTPSCLSSCTTAPPPPKYDYGVRLSACSDSSAHCGRGGHDDFHPEIPPPPPLVQQALGGGGGSPKSQTSTCEPYSWNASSYCLTHPAKIQVDQPLPSRLVVGECWFGEAGRSTAYSGFIMGGVIDCVLQMAQGCQKATRFHQNMAIFSRPFSPRR